MGDSLDYLLSAKYERVSIETFQEMMVELFEDDIPKMKTAEDVGRLFNNKGESEHIVWFSRLLCAAYMKLNADRFLPFLGEEWPSIEEYCSREVEPQGKECEQLQVIALAEVLHINVVIEYLSAAADQITEPVKLGPEDAAISIKFIYRPGHYDVLYS
jgi:ubiquitin thioesterase protein OTUB1